MYIRTGLVVLCFTTLSFVAVESLAADNDFGVVVREAEVKVGFRYRFENVDDNRLSKDADASTLRSRISLSTGRWQGFRLFVEADDVSEIGANDFNAGAGNTPSRTDYPVVADPRGTEINQAYLGYSSGGWNVRIGRQRINYDNQRFVGGVGWRQNEQTYDALKIDYANDFFKAQYSFVRKVSRIFGDDVPAGEHDQDGTHLLNVSGTVDGLGKLTGYYYQIDNEDALVFSTDTIGLRLSSTHDLGQQAAGGTGVVLRYTAEFAHQSDAGDNPVSYNTQYWNLDAGLVAGRWGLGLGWEVLGGDAGKPGAVFQTPLATLHAFNGWADMFLSTPQAGLDDRYLKVKFEPGAAVLQLRYHSFKAEDGGSDYGDEFDASIGYKINDWLRADVKYARFEGEGGFADASKYWLMMTAGF